MCVGLGKGVGKGKGRRKKEGGGVVRGQAVKRGGGQAWGRRASWAALELGPSMRSMVALRKSASPSMGRYSLFSSFSSILLSACATVPTGPLQSSRPPPLVCKIPSSPIFQRIQLFSNFCSLDREWFGTTL